MKKKFILMVLIVLGVVLLAGCLMRSFEDSVPDEVNVEKGSSFQFSFAASGPTWNSDIEDESIVEFIGYDSVRIEPPDVDSASAEFTLLFRAIKKGKTLINLNYSKYNGGEVMKKIEVYVN